MRWDLEESGLTIREGTTWGGGQQKWFFDFGASVSAVEGGVSH